MRLFGGRGGSEHGLSWVDRVTDRFAVADGTTVYEGGAPIPIGAGRQTINGVLPYVNTIWTRYGEVGEFHAQANFIAACLSRCTLRLGVLDIENRIGPAFDDKGKPLAGVPVRLATLAARMIASLRTAPGMVTDAGPVGGQSMILANMGRNLAGPAVCYLIATKTPTGDHWEVLSTVELVPIDTPKGEKQKFRRRRQFGGTTEEVTPDFYLRIFRPHPAASGEADSSVVPLLSTLERLALLNAEGLADSKSRLKGPGVYWIATEADFPGTDDDPEGYNYMSREFTETATTGIKNPGSAAAQVPLVARAPLAVIKDGLRHDRFDYNDTALIEKRGAAVGDLARGADLPYESTVGYSESSFANAFAVDEQLTRIFVAPWLDLICGFLTGGWLTNGLVLATGGKPGDKPSDDIARLCVWYDTSDLVTSPDPTKVAQWAYGTDTNPNNIINAKGVRRLLGIPEAEAPTDEETDERVERSQKLRARSEKGDNNPDTNPDDPTPDDTPDGERDTGEEVGKRVMSVADMAVSMAVGSVGNKLRGKCASNAELRKRIDGVDAADVARVLGPAVVESMGGTGPLFNGAFHAFERTVRQEFMDVGRDDAADLAAAAVRMAQRAALARLANPTARLDAHMAAEFLALLNR